ncbi:dipeptidyl aminopeptidase [Actinosynnema sp. ALI-1.44]|uniref:alpha/beta hydrolase n=1 Tax=Actinosynnema sp. ALI-1.44 TaxID=1933779 RepID=UPI00097C815B|nr:alpha/beta fold hydrolase [Actinosynnema sp. ALI-1.44]ONI76131.1 dipeptidyl aminopeptidase [Actinosynnema sp. ALI-1.44]
MRRLFFEKDETFWFETLRSFSHIAYGGADFGEVVETAAAITAGDYDSWYRAWLTTADRVAGEAERSLAGGHRVSARKGLLRASNYYRSAEFFLHGNPADPRITTAYDRAVDCWHHALELFDTPAEPVRIPYQDTTLAGYFYQADNSGVARPTVIINNGFDGTAEETYFMGGAAALERGYNVLTFDGPGQGEAIHRQGLTFRPDWEAVVTPVVDFARALPEVDSERIALYGISLSGMLAPRAAAFDPRIKALITFDGVYDSARNFITEFGDREQALAALRAESAPEVDAALAAAVEQHPSVRWLTSHGQWVMGASTSREFLATFCDYNLLGGVAEKIECPTLVCAAEHDGFFTGQPEELYEHLNCPKRFVEFTSADGSDEHCQAGVIVLAGCRIYDWLDEVLG